MQVVLIVAGASALANLAFGERTDAAVVAAFTAFMTTQGRSSVLRWSVVVGVGFSEAFSAWAAVEQPLGFVLLLVGLAALIWPGTRWAYGVSGARIRPSSSEVEG